MTWAVLKDVLLAILAIYGAVLSTFNWRQALGKDRRLVKVEISTVVLTYTDGSLGAPFARFTATNVGHRPVTITSLFIELAGKHKIVATSHDSFPQPDTRLPVELKDGASAVLHMSYADIAGTLAHSGRIGVLTLTPAAEDSAGNVHRGRPWRTSAEELTAATHGRR